MPYVRSYPHRRRLFARRYRHTRRYGRRRRLSNDLSLLVVFAVVLVIIALATSH